MDALVKFDDSQFEIVERNWFFMDENGDKEGLFLPWSDIYHYNLMEDLEKLGILIKEAKVLATSIKEKVNQRRLELEEVSVAAA